MSLLVVHANDGEPLVALGAEVAAARAASSDEDLVASRASSLSKFEIASRSLLRATSANCPLRSFGAALRQTTQLRPPSLGVEEAEETNNSDDFHPWSRAVRWINEFWSHSWHDTPWLKVVVLMLEYNGAAATIVGTFAAFVALVFFAAGLLPGMVLNHTILWGQELLDGSWCLLFGVFSFVSTLLCWRSGRQVFLDKICISQTNDKKKLDAVMGIGGFLKASKCMLVLMDSTYTTRLWCVFELAAYSKLMENDSEKVLRVRPLAFATIFVSMFGANTVVRLWKSFMNSTMCAPSLLFVFLVVSRFPMSHGMRRHQDATAKLKGKLLEFSMEASHCFCCSVGHVNPDSGALLSCDRQAVNACVKSWFGSCEAFNAFVKHSLHDKLASEIGTAGLPYRLILMTQLPVLWYYMDRISAMLRQSMWEEALAFTCVLPLAILVTCPFLVACDLKVAYWARRNLSSRYADAGVSLGVAIASKLLHDVIKTISSCSGVAFLAIHSFMGIVTIFVYGVRVRCRPFGSRTPSFPERGRSLGMN